MIKEKLNYISLSFYLLVGALESQKKKKTEKKDITFLLLRIRLKQMDENPEK